MTLRSLPENAGRPTALLLTIATGLLPLQIWPPMPLPGMQLSDIFFAAAFAHFLLARFPVPPARAALPILAFAAGAAASAAFGGSAAKLLGHLMLAAIAWMAACASPADCRLLRRALVAAAALAALTAMAGLALFFAGIAGYDAAGLPQHPLLYLHGALVSDSYPRPRGTMVTGALLTSVVAAGLLLLWFERDLVPGAWLRRGILAIGAIALFFAFSRSIATFAVVLISAELLRRESPLWLRGAWIGALAAYVAALWITLRYRVLLNPMEPWAVEVLGADGDRFERWRIAVRVIAENPLLGVGPGVNVADGWSVHNAWLNLWATLGIVPLTAFAFLLIAALRSALRPGAIGTACALVFMLIESLYNDIEDLRHLWLLIGISLALGPQARRLGPAAPSVQRHSPGAG